MYFKNNDFFKSSLIEHVSILQPSCVNYNFNFDDKQFLFL